MKKRIGILCAMVIMIGIPLAVKASEASDDSIKSYGSFFYEGADGSVRFYSEDLALLQEKLSSVPDEIFDPALYSPWESVDVTEQSHNTYTPEEEMPYTVFAAPSGTSDNLEVIEPKTLDMDMEAEEKLQPESEKTEENMVTSAPDSDELSEISVSGNDCVDDNGTSIKTDEVAQEIMEEEEGENNL